jgi:hypothetical protein
MEEGKTDKFFDCVGTRNTGLNATQKAGFKILAAKLSQLEARSVFMDLRYGQGTVKAAFLASAGLPLVTQVNCELYTYNHAVILRERAVTSHFFGSSTSFLRSPYQKMVQI